MATNTDIRIKVRLFRSPKFKKLGRAMGVEAQLALIHLWTEVAEHRPNGVMTGWDATDVASMVAWTGNADEFVGGLLALRWLDETPDGLAIHDWRDHNGWCFGAEARASQARTASNTRWDKVRKSKKNTNKSGNSCVVVNAVSNAVSNPPSPSPSLNGDKEMVLSLIPRRRSQVVKPVSDEESTLVYHAWLRGEFTTEDLPS